MSDFEFIFALFGLLLGLSFAEVLGGAARVVDARLRAGPALRIGWLTPLMAAFLLLDLLSFWAAAWAVRGSAVVSGHSLLALAAFTSAYYIAASLVFPRDLSQPLDLDEHFFRVRRIVIGDMLILLVCQAGWYLSIHELAAKILRPFALTMTAVLLILMVAALIVRGKAPAHIVMAALVGRYIVAYLI